ncbi:hypothetical protein GJ496_001748 [Pomphorhynchus laevis]|nr:hypothetical protein GJ496_001748 [Pomphorhynchus laevis]
MKNIKKDKYQYQDGCENAAQLKPGQQMCITKTTYCVCAPIPHIDQPCEPIINVECRPENPSGQSMIIPNTDYVIPQNQRWTFNCSNGGGNSSSHCNCHRQK